MKYRADNQEGNPAKMFRLRTIGFFKLKDLKNLNQYNAQPLEHRADEDGEGQSHKEDFMGVMTVLLEADEIKTVGRLPWTRLTREEEKKLKKSGNKEDWFTEVQDNIAVGLVWANVEELDDEECIPGLMHRDGKAWKWQEATSEEMNALDWPDKRNRNPIA